MRRDGGQRDARGADAVTARRGCARRGPAGVPRRAPCPAGASGIDGDPQRLGAARRPGSGRGGVRPCRRRCRRRAAISRTRSSGLPGASPPAPRRAAADGAARGRPCRSCAENSWSRAARTNDSSKTTDRYSSSPPPGAPSGVPSGGSPGPLIPQGRSAGAQVNAVAPTSSDRFSRRIRCGLHGVRAARDAETAAPGVVGGRPAGGRAVRPLSRPAVAGVDAAGVGAGAGLRSPEAPR